MKNLVAILLLVLLIIVSLRLYTLNALLKDREHRIQDLTATLEALPKTPTLEQQSKCAAQARQEFDLEGYKPGGLARFESHYNLKLNKCFVEILSTDTKNARPEILTSKTLVDAFEGKLYASYIWQTQKGKKFWEVPPLECKVTLVSGAEKTCKGDEEFDQLVKQYME